MRALPILVIGVVIGITGQTSAQGPGFADGLGRALEQGERLRMERERLQMEHRITRERMRQMDLQNQLQRQEQDSRVREHELMFQEQILRTRLMELENQDQQRVPSDPPTHGSSLDLRPPTAQDDN